MRTRRAVSMTEGSIFKNLIAFSFPLILATILQSLYNTADMAVAGQFCGTEAVSSIAASTPICSLAVFVFVGFSTGTNVIVAYYIGARDHKNLHRAVQTSVWGALFLGLGLGVAGFFLAGPLLRLTACPEVSYPNALLYLRYFFLGVPGSIVYNFAAAVLRAKGDSTKPLFFLGISGLANVGMNLFAVLVLGMGVAGVALATTVASTLAAMMAVVALIKDRGECHFSPKEFLIDPHKVGRILRIGFPVALQNSFFTISNLQIQSAVNALGPATMTGNSASTTLEGYVASVSNSFNAATVSFVSQNRGAGNFERIPKVTGAAALVSSLVGGGAALLLLAFCRPLLGLVIGSDPLASAAIDVGQLRLTYLMSFFAVSCLYGVFDNTIRGLGYSLVPTLISVFSVCIWRIFWMAAVYPHYLTIDNLYLCYVCSWSLNLVGMSIALLVTYRLFRKNHRPRPASTE